MFDRNWQRWFTSEKGGRRTVSPRLQVEQLEDRWVPSGTPAVDLSTAGASGSVNGAMFQQFTTQPDGSGVINAFLRIQGKGKQAVEQGYNTDARPLQFDEKTSASFTHSIRLSDLPVITIGGVVYRELDLDINQNNNNPLLSLDELRFYVSPSSGALTGYDPSTHLLGGQAPVYDLGAGNWILLNNTLNSGSGKGDMLAYIPNSVFQGAGDDPYVYLYSKFGVNQASNGGFEQWAPAVSVPATGPASISGFVYDKTHATLLNPNPPFAGVTVTLTGTDSQGNTLTLTAVTAADGSYSFTGLAASDSAGYTLTVTNTVNNITYQNDGESVGTVNGVSGDGSVSTSVPFVISAVGLNAGDVGIEYNFALINVGA